jgi:hypothetical protein
MTLYSDSELLADVRRVAEEVGGPPTYQDYEEYGEYGMRTIERRFDSWIHARTAAGVDFRQLVSDDAILKDLRQVAADIGKSPSSQEYQDYGRYGVSRVQSRFDGWSNAKIAAGLTPGSFFNSSEELLRDIRQKSDDTEIGPLEEFSENNLQSGRQTYANRFGGLWEAVVRAGRKPRIATPLPVEDYDKYIQTAINADYPSVSLLALLKAFTGFPQRVFRAFDSSWVSRLDSDLQATLITVPSDLISDDDDWVMMAPAYYTVNGEEKPTRLEPLLEWAEDREISKPSAKDGMVDRILNRAGLDVGSQALRATVATHLARQEVSSAKIEMQVGASKTNWDRSIEDYFLYLYQFEDYCHPDYEPSGTYLDPDSGEPERIESDGD